MQNTLCTGCLLLVDGLRARIYGHSVTLYLAMQACTQCELPHSFLFFCIEDPGGFFGKYESEIHDLIS